MATSALALWIAFAFATQVFADVDSTQCLDSSTEGLESCRAMNTGGSGSGPSASAVPSDHLLLQLASTSAETQRGQKTGWTLPVFFWNVHWECSLAARGASHNCKRKIGHRFVELAHASKAEVVASVELSDTASRPASLSAFGLRGWTQVNGPCKRGHGGDAAALAFAPGWVVEKSDGGCLRKDYDTRAFAVALVVPPKPVSGCPKLCVVAIHAPHTRIDHGKEMVRQVCHDAVEQCTIAMGDWNVPARGVGNLWSQLIGGKIPKTAKPDTRTCCWPESHHYGVFDHLASNIQGAVHAGETVHPYQLLEENPRKQHKPVTALLRLP